MASQQIWRAGPQFYENIHVISFDTVQDQAGTKSGNIKLVHGTGLNIYLEASGSYELIATSKTSYELKIKNLKLVSGLELPDMSFTCVLDSRTYYDIFENHVIHTQTKYLKLSNKIIFDVDPIMFYFDTLAGSNFKSLDEFRSYYVNIEETTREILIDLGISFTHNGYYFHDIDFEEINRNLEVRDLLQKEFYVFDPELWSNIYENNKPSSMLTCCYNNHGALIGCYIIERDCSNIQEILINLVMICTQHEEVYSFIVKEICDRLLEANSQVQNTELVLDLLSVPDQELFKKHMDNNNLKLEIVMKN